MKTKTVMKKSILLITLFVCALFSLNAQAQFITGTVVGFDGDALEGITVHLFAECNDSTNFQVDTVTTDEQGYFEATLPICEEGFVTATIFCEGNVMSRSQTWGTENATVHMDFICSDNPNPGDSCYVGINQLGISPDLPFALEADAYGDAPFAYNWSTGETTPEIIVNEEGEYCVTVTDATGCQNFACKIVEDYSIDSTGCIHYGYVVDATGLDGCGLVVETESGQKLEPVNYPEILEAGQTIYFGYIELGSPTVCQIGPVIEFTCLEVIYVDTLCIDPDLIDPDAACDASYEPVCGCDGVTYSNACVAENSGVTHWTPGECNVDTLCIDPDLIDPNAVCYEIYAPVCGCDGITYPNDCYAEKSGVLNWTEGECANQGCQVEISFYQDFEDSIPSLNLFHFIATDWKNEASEFIWDFGNNETVITSEGKLSHQFSEEGLYDVCVTTVDAAGEACTACTVVIVGEDYFPCEIQITAYPDSSITNDSLLLGMHFSTITTSPQNQTVKYFWDFGDGTQSDEANPYHEYAEPGAYFVCVEIFGEDGDNCGWCDLFFVGDDGHYEDDCIDFDAIDLEETCPEIYEPVCGCDGITYENACIAETCFGLKSWTTGPCPNDPTNPIDSLLNCDISFEYTILANASSGYDVQFVTDGDEHVIYLWDFGDGVVSEEHNPTHHYEQLEDGNLAYTVCLFTIGGFQDSIIIDSSLCFGNYCETLVIDQDPDGLIDGTIYADSDGVRNGAVTRTNEGTGDPLAEVSVLLLNAKGENIAQSITDDKGEYSFGSLLFGNYQIKVEIEGIEHDPFQVKLNPVTQAREGIDFNVSGSEVTTSISNITFAQSINVYPNPVTTNLQIDMLLPVAKELTIKLSNLFGQLISQEIKDFSKGNQGLNIDMSNFASGIYIISLSSDTEVYTQKIIKQ